MGQCRDGRDPTCRARRRFRFAVTSLASSIPAASRCYGCCQDHCRHQWKGLAGATRRTAGTTPGIEPALPARCGPQPRPKHHGPRAPPAPLQCDAPIQPRSHRCSPQMPAAASCPRPRRTLPRGSFSAQRWLLLRRWPAGLHAVRAAWSQGCVGRGCGGQVSWALGCWLGLHTLHCHRVTLH